MTTLQENIKRHIMYAVVEDLRDMVYKYEEEQKIFKPGVNPYLDGLVDGIHKAIKKLEEEM